MQRNVALALVTFVFLLLAALAPVLEIERLAWLLAGILIFMLVDKVWRN